MIVIRESILSGKVHKREINITARELDRILSGAEHVQHVVPHLSADDREFIINGITPEEWDKYMGEEREE